MPCICKIWDMGNGCVVRRLRRRRSRIAARGNTLGKGALYPSTLKGLVKPDIFKAAFVAALANAFSVSVLITNRVTPPRHAGCPRGDPRLGCNSQAPSA